MIQSIFSDHNGMKQEIKMEKWTFQKYMKINNLFLNSQ